MKELIRNFLDLINGLIWMFVKDFCDFSLYPKEPQVWFPPNCWKEATDGYYILNRKMIEEMCKQFKPYTTAIHSGGLINNGSIEPPGLVNDIKNWSEQLCQVTGDSISKALQK